MEHLQRTAMAFPVALNDKDVQLGMTLRDYFAGQYIQGIIANSYVAEHGGIASSIDHMNARHAYAMADAMLEARKL